MAILAADVGNTTVTLALVDKGRADTLARVASSLDPTELVALLKGQMEATMATGPVIDGTEFEGTEFEQAGFEGAVLSSVVPNLSEPVSAFLQTRTAGQVLVVTSATPLPIQNAYATPATVGVDRLANAVGGAVRYGTPIIVVDAGTAVTIDVVSREGLFLGGAILPGADLWADALAHFTAALPRVDLQPPASPVGNTTVENIRSGIINGLAGAIDRLVELTCATTGPETPAILTGGGAPLIVDRCRSITHHEPNLTLRGLAEIYRHNNRS